MAIRLDIAGGMDTRTSPDQLKTGFPYLQNVRRNLESRTIARPPLGANLAGGTLPSGPTSVTRMNDPYMGGAGYVLIEGAAGKMYVNASQVASGLSGKPLSFLPYRPPASPQPWCYVGDGSLAAVLNGYGSYTGPVCGMAKVRSDGTIYKTGVMEPQAAPGVTFPGGGSGTTQIFYRYTYRSSVTGAVSNPSPESTPGTNAQSSPSATVNASDYATKITFNAAQWAYVAPQLRTTGSVGPGTVMDYVIAHNFGLSIPNGVNIDGVQIDLNWVGQNSGTGVLSGVALYYLGQQIGTAKFPNIQNQSFTTDTLQGGNSDKWGTTLTPSIVNDPSFGFGVQITTQAVGGSDRSFLDYFTITIYYSTQNADITPTASTDPQVDKIDFYRMGGALTNFTYVGTGPNTATTFTDSVGDLVAVDNPQLQFDNFEPFPSIDLPRKGTVNSDGAGNITWVSGDTFNARWLPGTDIVIGGVAYVLYNRPSSTTALKAYNITTDPTTNWVTIGYPPSGTGLTYEIAEPTLAAQPSPVIWGPTPDNAGSFYFGLDPNNPGDLVWSKGNNFDSAPDTNRMYVTSPSEALQNGTVTSELSTVFSTERFWLIYPNFADAVATVTGTAGQQWVLVQSAATRGLYMRYAIGALGALIAWRAKDCICVSMGGSREESISDAIYNLFPHAGQAPSPVTIAGFTVYPPDDTKPNAQTITVTPGYIFYDYQDVNGNPRTLVYDIEAKGWSVDAYSPAVNCHAWAVGSVYQVLTGCADGTVRALDSTGTETATAVIVTRSETGGSTRVLKRIGGVFLRAVAAVSITLNFFANRYQTAISGFAPATAGTGSAESDYLTDFTAAANADVNDLGAVFSWPVGSANILSEWMPDWTEMPQPIIGWHTGLLSYGQIGWKHIAWMDIAYKSTAPVTLVATMDTGATFTLTLPSTGGAQQKSYTVVPVNKWKLVGWTANSTAPFTIFADDCEMHVSSWGGEGFAIKPFSGMGFGTPEAST